MQNQNIYQIFISCEKKYESQVLKFYKILKKNYELSVWFACVDTKKGQNASLAAKTALKSSQVFVCCLSREYTATKENIDDVKLAIELSLPAVVIELETTKPENFEGLRPLLNFATFKVYANKEGQVDWFGDEYDRLIEKLEEILNIQMEKPSQPKDQITEIFHNAQIKIDRSYEKVK